MLAYPAEQYIDVNFQVDPSLIGYYNARLGTNYAMLDAKYYKFYIIPQGKRRKIVATKRMVSCSRDL